MGSNGRSFWVLKLLERFCVKSPPFRLSIFFESIRFRVPLSILSKSLNGLFLVWLSVAKKGLVKISRDFSKHNSADARSHNGSRKDIGVSTNDVKDDRSRC